jgi:type IV pilus assembly protein PilP
MIMRHSLLFLAVLGLLGCGEDPVQQSTPPARSSTRAKKAVEETAKDDVIPPAVDFQETAFVESERSRDPFRNYAKYFIDEARGAVISQREVMLEQYSIDELRLVALIQRLHPARAMLIDPTGLGHVVQRGQYIGRASVVQPAGGVGAAYEVNWRVDRIRDGDLVLVRDDPSNPDVPSATRVIPLRTDDLTVNDSADESSGAGIEAEIREMKERLERMAAAEAAKARRDEGQDTNP